MGKLFLISASFLLLTACSVKENRADCPLIIRFTERVNPYGCTADVNVSLRRDGEREGSDATFTIREFTGSEFELLAGKGHTLVSVLSGYDASVIEEGNLLRFKKGMPVPEMFALSDEFTSGTYDEEHVVMDSLCRQTAAVIMTIDNPEWDDRSYDMRVRSSWNGFDRITMTALSGELVCDIAAAESSSVYRFFIPRQGDNSLTLELREKDGRIWSYPIGKVIADSGYDWGARHLPDIFLTMDISKTIVSITVNEWEEEFVSEFTF